jgi:hypothetical protein
MLHNLPPEKPSHKCRLWSLGVFIWFLMCGRFFRRVVIWRRIQLLGKCLELANFPSSNYPDADGGPDIHKATEAFVNQHLLSGMNQINLQLSSQIVAAVYRNYLKTNRLRNWPVVSRNCQGKMTYIESKPSKQPMLSKVPTADPPAPQLLQ